MIATENRKTPRRRPTGRRLHEGGRHLTSSERSRIAYLAGQGKSAQEIADAVGGTTAAAIYQHIRRAGLSLTPKAPTHVAFVMVMGRAEFDRLIFVATGHDIEPEDLSRRLLNAVIAEPVLLANLIDDILPA